MYHDHHDYMFEDMVTSPVIIISVKGVHVHVLSVHKDILPRRMGNN